MKTVSHRILEKMVQVAVEIIVAVKAMLVDERRNHAGLEEITTKLSFPECLPFCRPECLRISRKHTSFNYRSRKSAESCEPGT